MTEEAKITATWSGFGMGLSLDGFSLDLSLLSCIQNHIRILNPFSRKLRFLGGIESCIGSKTKKKYKPNYAKDKSKVIESTTSIIFIDDLSMSLQFGDVSKNDGTETFVVELHLFGLRFVYSRSITIYKTLQENNGKKRRK